MKLKIEFEGTAEEFKSIFAQATKEVVLTEEVKNTEQSESTSQVTYLDKDSVKGNGFEDFSDI